MKMKSNKTKILLLAASVIVSSMMLALESCTKEKDSVLDIPSAKNYPGLEEDVALTNEFIDKYSKVIAVALENVDFRMLVKQSALQQFDGDYDVLVTDLHEKELPTSGKSVFDFLSSVVDDYFLEEFKMDGRSFLDEVVSVIPNLQLAVPIHIEKWEPAAFRPYVIPLPFDFVDGEDYMVDGYDDKLSTIQVSSKIKPNFPIIVVGVSERINKDGHPYKIPSGPLKEIAEVLFPAPSHLYCEYTTAANAVRLRWPLVPGAVGYAVYQTDDMGNDVLIGTTSGTENIFNSTGLETARTYQYMVRSIDSDGEYSSYTNVAEITATDRRSGDPLRLKSFQFSKDGLYAVESYLKGAPEVQLRIIKPDGTGDNTVVLHTVRYDIPTRSAVTSSPYVCNEVMFSSWTQSRYNDVLIFEWREIDNCFPDEVNIKASYTIDAMRTFLGRLDVNASTMFKVSTNSHIARHNVCYWDPKNYSYGNPDLTAGFTFSVDANLNN